MTSDWMLVTQDLVDRFADVSGDRQWIHTDPSRGQTIAHGFLILSLFSSLLTGARTSGPQSADLRSDDHIEGAGRSINYGLDRVRFIAPVKVGARIRGRFERASEEEKDGGTKVIWNVTIEDEQQPCCVAQWIVLYMR